MSTEMGMIRTTPLLPQYADLKARADISRNLDQVATQAALMATKWKKQGAGLTPEQQALFLDELHDAVEDWCLILGAAQKGAFRLLQDSVIADAWRELDLPEDDLRGRQVPEAMRIIQDEIAWREA